MMLWNALASHRMRQEFAEAAAADPELAIARLEALLPVMRTLGPPHGAWNQAAEDILQLISMVRR